MKNISTLQRIKQYIDYKGLSNKKFEESVGFSNGAFASQLKNERTIGVDKLENILNEYPEINSEWILTGKGKMLKKEGENEKIMKTEADPKDQYIIELQRDKIKSLENEIERIKKANKPQPGYQHAAEPE